MLDLKTTFRARKFTRRIINSLNLNAEEFLMSDKVLQAAEISKIHANVEWFLAKVLNISRYYTDDWGAYDRHIDKNKQEIGKANTQKIERKNLNFRTWIKRLTRQTICFSKLEKMHDIVIGLQINKVEFERNIYA